MSAWNTVIRKNITITKELTEWIDENHINPSCLVRACIDAKRRESGTADYRQLRLRVT